MRTHIFVMAALAGLLGSTLVLVGVGEPVSQRASIAVAEAPDATTALAAAARQGTRVAVADQRTPNKEVYANPGGTFTAEISAVPTRVQRNGDWIAVDTTMSARPDGLVGPKAAVGDLALSPGGDAPLLQLRSGRHSFALHWPTPLPAPKLDGSSATYAEVFPGVDLVIHAERSGYRQHLVVKTPAAGRNPALARLDLRVVTPGLRLAVDKRGVLTAADTAGEVVFEAPPSVMWDSTGQGADSARSAPVGVEVADGAMTLVPDRDFLTDPDVTYPVFIDPNTLVRTRMNWANVLSGRPTTAYWWTSGEPPHAQVGQCYTASGGCDGIGEAWAYFQFDTRDLSGKHILGASLNTVIVHSPNCSARTHELYIATDQVYNGMTWNTRRQGGKLSEASMGGVWSSCTGYKPAGFAVGNNGIGAISTYFIKAKDSADQIAWRKLDPAQTKLSVNYNTVPDKPTSLSTDPPIPNPCKWCGGTAYLGDADMRLRANLTDDDNDTLRAQWRVAADGVEIASWDGASQASGATHDANIHIGDKHGKRITWWVHGTDGTDSSPAAAGPRAFIVDRQAPGSVPTVASALYPQDDRWHGGPGIADVFTFRSGGVSDIDHYLYGWSTPPSQKVEATSLGGPAYPSIAPPGDGPRTLYVQSVDRAGHKSDVVSYRIYVRAGNGAYAQWSFEGNADDSAFLGDRHGTVEGSVAYVPGATGTGARFDGASAVVAPNAVRTDTGFSVSAWVRPENITAGGRAVAAQQGDQASGWFLNYRDTAVGKRWSFMLADSDRADATGTLAVSQHAPQEGVWTHLTGVFDKDNQRVLLYVNGELVDTEALPQGFVPWHAPGRVLIGKEKWNGIQTNPWLGAIDEVQVFDRVLSDSEVRAAVARSNVQVGHWRFDDERVVDGQPNQTARNTVEGGDAATLAGGAVFTADSAVAGTGHGSVSLDGVDDHLTTSRNAVRTDHSFTVGAYVKLAQTGGARAIASQDGQRNAGFALWYRDGKWVFALPHADSDTSTGWDAATAPQNADATLNEWVHVMGVYDAPTGQLRLYVGGELAATAQRGTPVWNAGGAFRIGQTLWQGNLVDAWSGLVDEVRVYSRALNEDEIAGIVGQNNVRIAAWALDGDTVEATSGRPTEKIGDVQWAAGRADHPDPADLGMKLGGGGHLSTPKVVTTTESFSVTAWVRPDRGIGWAGVVSQDGARTSGFVLGTAGDGRWNLFLPSADSDNASGARVVGGAVQYGVWTHLTAVYSKQRQRVDLYVNGVHAGGTAHTGGFDATGPLVIGRSKWNGTATDYFSGTIDDVSIYNRPLNAAEVVTLAGRDLTLVHNWRFDEAGGAYAADSVGVRDGELVGGASFAPGRVGNAARFDGTDDSAAVSGIDLRTDKSFAVGAWVYLDGGGHPVTAVSMDSGDHSKFRLGHSTRTHPEGAWVFEMPGEDGVVAEAAVTVIPSEINTWVHLVGVYDAPAGKLWLYVDGSRIDDGTLEQPWQGTGPLVVGRARTAGQPTWHWSGLVDDVRLYTGVLDADRVWSLFTSYPAPVPAPMLPVPDAGHWKFDEGSGTTAADSTANGRTATMHGGALWHGGRIGSTSWLDGSTGYAATAGPVLTTSASFSVSTWVYPRRSATQAILSQDGATRSAFVLRQDGPGNRWVVEVPASDAAGAPTTVITSAETVPVGHWTHLTVAYDAAADRVSLYVNGLLSAVGRVAGTWDSAGPFAIGRGKSLTADLFLGAIDDVQAFHRPISAGEVRKIYDKAYLAVHGQWWFDDDSVRDWSWRANPMTATAGITYVEGIAGKAARFDGASGSAVSERVGVPMVGSFTVSAWARATSGGSVRTILAQEGDRMSAFALQYRPESNRWSFGAAASDTDSAGWVQAQSSQPATLNRWTHVTGVYDYPGQQIRVYVDGKLAGVRNNVALWPAWGGFAIGRGKVNGAPGQFFAGDIDEVTIDMGMASDAEILRRATFPAPPAGQLGVYTNGKGDSYTASTSSPAPEGYHFSATLGLMPAAGEAGTIPLYACLYGTDAFTSPDPGCEGQTTLGEAGRVYSAAPSVPSTRVYRCRRGPDHFDSTDPTCGGATVDGPLGYTIAYAPLSRYYSVERTDHTMTVHGAPAEYRFDGVLGWLPQTAEPGTQPLYGCRSGADHFLSLDANCGGAQKMGTFGHIWPQPPAGLPTAPVYNCSVSGQRWVSRSPTCDGRTVEGLLGHLLTAPPDQASN
ncbi:LamG domain-containing protein [Actinokineospora sp. UTMC 2448]|uniref:LamG domain-containing protein n=1 Tax=Actinokineospora sp. UTMC 2448 TaxID=2268449 RepID=UPI0021649E90|nr:LamG domain-containing protein [Actinokineospora sp. UTMC 2448]UVS81293.1 Cell wall-associated polypeptide [Actinokineospora sp. UTMC 2448]